MEQRVARYQSRCDTLSVSNEDLQKKLTQQLEDQEHIMSLLKKKIQEQSEQCVELDEKLTVLKHEKEKEIDKLMKETALIREDAQDRLDQLVAENTVLHGTLDSLEEFRTNKDKLEADLKQKEETIKKQQKEFDEKIYQLEKQAVLDKDRMRKEMVAKVNSVAAEFRKVSDLQMADTTKRTIQENVAITQQLTRMSDKTTELVKENERMKERERELCRCLEMMETNERDMTRKNISNQKNLTMLKDKNKEQELSIKDLKEYKDKWEEAQEQLQQSQHIALTTTHQAECYKADLRAIETELKELQKRYKETKGELDRLKVLLSSTSKAIKTSVQEGQAGNTDNMMYTLLDLLVTAPNSRHSSRTRLTGNTSYKPGDLGIVPQQHSTNRTELPPLNSTDFSLTATK